MPDPTPTTVTPPVVTPPATPPPATPPTPIIPPEVMAELTNLRSQVGSMKKELEEKIGVTQSTPEQQEAQRLAKEQKRAEKTKKKEERMKQREQLYAQINKLQADMAELARANEYQNPDGTFKGGFEGCVSYMKSKGKAEEDAKKICGKIAAMKGGRFFILADSMRSGKTISDEDKELLISFKMALATGEEQPQPQIQTVNQVLEDIKKEVGLLRSAMDKVQVVKGASPKTPGAPVNPPANPVDDITQTPEYQRMSPKERLDFATSVMEKNGGFDGLRRSKNVSTEEQNS